MALLPKTSMKAFPVLNPDIQVLVHVESNPKDEDVITALFDDLNVLSRAQVARVLEAFQLRDGMANVIGGMRMMDDVDEIHEAGYGGDASSEFVPVGEIILDSFLGLGGRSITRIVLLVHEDHTPHRQIGVHLGYPSCCIEDYSGMVLSQQSQTMGDTGFVPCLNCSSTKTPEELIATIANNRRYEVPFPDVIGFWDLWLSMLLYKVRPSERCTVGEAANDS